jgi:hypothetical protein
MLSPKASKHASLRWQYKLVIALFTFLGLAIALILIWQFGSWSAHAFGIPPDAPVKTHPNGLMWFGIFIAVIVILIPAGIVGVLALLTIYFAQREGWSRSQMCEVFFHSNYPANWRKW